VDRENFADGHFKIPGGHQKSHWQLMFSSGRPSMCSPHMMLLNFCADVELRGEWREGRGEKAFSQAAGA
jgi:hypothetical protein